MLELLDMLDELYDPHTVNAVRESRKAVAAGAKGIPFEDIVAHVRAARKKK